MFSEDYNNLNNAIYRYNSQNLKTFAVVGGQGEGDARTYYELGGGEGYDLREVFVDAKDINPDGLTAEQYKAKTLFPQPQLRARTLYREITIAAKRQAMNL